ncbi:MAG TPA: RrF2 family transcriptional regulator [bacterium]|nr:RrF2 family transcriptional regulator [bacterium]HOL47109.1 RrF2 family transcriptional regulator [bacterium]HPQ18863.1 RrF2 family transcriptional regulator [bacterium]
MKLSTRTRYGIRALIYLALNYKNQPIQLNEISKNENISVRYLEQIMNKLISCGVVEGIRGYNGGFILTKPIDKINLYEVIKILEGNLTPVNCLDGSFKCDVYYKCGAKYIWEELNKQIKNTLNKISLKEIVNYLKKNKEKSIKSKLIYYI